MCVYDDYSPLLRVRPDGIPDDLKQLPFWVVWQLAPGGANKPKKVPVHPRTERPIDITRRGAGCSFSHAYESYRDGNYDGVGLILRREAGLVGYDLDGCGDYEAGDVQPWAEDIVRGVGTYAEWSPLRAGVRGFGRGDLDPGGPCKQGPVELYATDRFLTVTGHRLADAPAAVVECGPAARRLQDDLRDVGPRPQVAATSAPCRLDGATTTIVERAFAAANGERVKKLWAGDLERYPSPSEAVLALLQYLAFWVGPYPQRLDAVFRSSPLYRATEDVRQKWDAPRSRATWGAEQIDLAIGTCRSFYDPSAVPLNTTTPVAGEEHPPRVRTGVQLALLVRAWERARCDGVPPGVTFGDRVRWTREGKEKLFALCWQLGRRRWGGSFFLSRDTAADFLYVDPATTGRWLTDFCARGLLRRVRKGSRRSGRASDYVLSGVCPRAGIRADS
ncbi:hypothetical protein [Fimbriiglobus ruber]|uniref:DNA primase/helicase, phage-associated n=1 Tax=Fimbriiglobus ruber TaxID=1908690 RepID=A0A225DJI9_9BACT|nr:hypothetical protein [Fimbriiglobus ruber]OWK39874.1 DNA primase/helicase, phage-associated [Fimbriiglobus ruber]